MTCSRYFRKYFYGFPLITLLICVLEIIVGIYLVYALEPLLFIIIAIINISASLFVIIGVIARQRVLFWPYIVTKALIIISSVLALGYTIVAHLIAFFDKTDKASAEKTGFGLLFGIILGAVIIVNGIPMLIVQKYLQELIFESQSSVNNTNETENSMESHELRQLRVIKN